MRRVILYQSKFGSAKQYADWLREDLGNGDLMNLRDFDASELEGYEQVVVVSSIYVGEVMAMSFLKKHWQLLKEKETFLLVVGNAPPESEESKQSYLLIPDEIRTGLKGYYKVPGKIDFQKLGFMYKLMLWFKGVRQSEDKMDRGALSPLLADLMRAGG